MLIDQELSAPDSLARERNRYWLILLVGALVAEALGMAKEHAAVIRRLTVQGGAQESELKHFGLLTSGKSQVAKDVKHIRNKAIFHWDASSIRNYLKDLKDDPVTVVRGDSSEVRDVVHQLAGDAVATLSLSTRAGERPVTPDVVAEWANDIFNEAHWLMGFFERCIVGYLIEAEEWQAARGG